MAKAAVPISFLCGAFYASCLCLEGVCEQGQAVRVSGALWPWLGVSLCLGKVITIMRRYPAQGPVHLALGELAKGYQALLSTYYMLLGAYYVLLNAYYVPQYLQTCFCHVLATTLYSGEPTAGIVTFHK